jgi:hypothetical protein
MVILEIIKFRFNQGKDQNIYFYRDKNMNEVDILYRYGPSFIPLEIKSTQTYNKSLCRGLRYFKKILPDQISESFLCYDGEFEDKINDIYVVNYKNVSRKLSKIEKTK